MSEISPARRALIDLLEDITRKLRNHGCTKYEAITDLETALEEAEDLDPKEDVQ